MILSYGRQVLSPLEGNGNATLVYALELTLEEVARGTRKNITISEKSICEHYQGSNTGCDYCNGTGTMEEERTMPLTIPAGIEEGMQLKLAGKGDSKGDIYVEVIILPHSRFERDCEGNIYCKIPLLPSPPGRAKEFQVPTIDGSRLVLKVGSKTKRGTMFVLRGRGLPKFGASTHGDLFVKIV